ncbi:LytR/AlgR family response regulator transcription factor [Natranaerobius thermophilus]|uniref:Stage 0 sporulation protein A homolog n=1 Tax=Natranaerobius thermophilus (strain ATCC BAA-1301 / DSM 18059 / JW/NM-WN-LF) TaxID=457570 RepID=B2A276_NATTJ|nr:response regulator [Natranaerobius thermophilus]ACB86184.1 response regulator receiver protein [Natranaerobius thermophilus JW/NM-WN-LF]
MNILILEDEPYTQKFLKVLISRSEYVGQVVVTTAPEYAVKYAKSNEFHIAIVDVELYGKVNSGLEAAELVKQAVPEIEFIFVTAHNTYFTESSTVKPYEYLIKPIDEHKLLEIITEIAHFNSQSQNNTGD